MTTIKQRAMLESRLQTYFVRKCKDAGVYAIKVVSVGRRGFPDVVVIIDGKVRFVELKQELKGRLSFPQMRTIAEMEGAGGDVDVLYGVPDVLVWCSTFLPKPKP
jgi:hypothetical protein